MSLVQRFTRDSASKYVWGALLVAAVTGLVFSFTAGSDAIRDERLRAEQRSVAIATEVIAPRLEGVDVGAPIAGRDASALRQAIDGSIGADRRVASVRIWSVNGELLFSTDRADDAGSDAALNDELLQRAGNGETLTRWNLSDVGGIDERGRSLVRTYTPIRSGVVAEVDHTEEGTIGPIASSWLRYRILAAVLVACFLVMAILSLRDPLDRINTGVPFAPTGIPAGYSLIDDERLNAVEEVYRLAHERVAKLEARLAESEEARRGLEGDLQRALTSASTGSTTPMRLERVVPPTDQAPAAPRPAPGSSSSPETPAATRRGALIDRAVQPSAAPPPSPPAAEPKRRRPKRPAPAPTPGQERPATPVPAADRPAASTSDPVTPPPAVAPAADVVTVPDSDVVGPDPARSEWSGLGTRRDEAERQIARAPQPASPSPSTPRPERSKRQRLKRNPEPVAATVATTPVTDAEASDAAAHEAALETFIRLTERDREPHETADVDQGAVRAALARTAARKKPGGARLQPPEEPAGEVPGGGPRRDRR